MRVLETDPATAARNREQGARAQLLGGCAFAVAIVIMCMGGTMIWPLALAGLVLGCLGRMVADSNKIGG